MKVINRFLMGTIFALIGLYSSFTLTIEKINYLLDPNRVTVCDINPIVACGTIMKSSQAETFGFPNSILGIIGFTAMIVYMLLQYTKHELSKWVHYAALVGITFAVGFSFYLFYVSTFIIGAICIYCMSVWIASIILAGIILKTLGKVEDRPHLEDWSVFYSIMLIIFILGMMAIRYIPDFMRIL